ncbi:MAG: rhodanese-like domain-containing protein, partial [Saprospiraceae bacterium]|nr:rhodanese-like domain-containing protein [Saprospiraceae bacterium]
EMMKQENVITIDIRTPEEIAKGKILDSALEMDYYADDYKSKLEAMNRDDQYVVYCRSGGRSGKTLKMMKDMGFTNAYNVLGGYNAFMELKK